LTVYALELAEDKSQRRDVTAERFASRWWWDDDDDFASVVLNN